MQLPSRYRMPTLALIALVLALLVVAGILLVGRIGIPDVSPSPSPSTPAASATDLLSTPEGAVRGFFSAFAAARRTDDPAGVASFVTGTDSAAYLSISGFLQGQKEARKASIVTEQRLDNLKSTIDGEMATVTFDFTEGGYDIALDSGSPLESPKVLPAYRVTVTLKADGSRWLVDSYTSRQ